MKTPRLDLSREIRELAGLCANQDWDTDDALGIGGLLLRCLLAGAADRSVLGH